VTVEAGPFQGLAGIVQQEWNDRERVVIFLHAIEQARFLIEKRWLKLAAA
jgi:hypothetical protein